MGATSIRYPNIGQQTNATVASQMRRMLTQRSPDWVLDGIDSLDCGGG